ncbi:hypothetical protein PHYBLDRAFT_70115 [Phycomyces blakesleeanus NRRL 1555(-)]|uniref:Uncharacterized protein n=1 Tax=Phycomyces blakesleeanus (strain ATCC 8743b / DSM 1359 / FGSC 10004 / NBRC 33097 / NRRL 1555) TaxID=763407 RepID=A0A163DIX1_PHYB8|nr:hypothetical protein PHYBLDRAFT_70115 [Phycomyces blakesleeanus NRRL 1555(-)]OAD71550.1 hypothetical protein PHYBLDRAFT_70115 [Phycomyces blakesleeanus NRRL 1555(-)]|eukprot:XP_018289590.1 hypothetical protein PHYBLDRAFT_70115 [Phycomyces blakesleeanus NRRL 1555(-)]
MELDAVGNATAADHFFGKHFQKAFKSGKTEFKCYCYGCSKEHPLLQIPDQILPENTTIILPRLSTFLNERITPIRNRLPTIPVNKATLSRNSQEIIPVLR